MSKETAENDSSEHERNTILNEKKKSFFFLLSISYGYGVCKINKTEKKNRIEIFFLSLVVQNS